MGKLLRLTDVTLTDTAAPRIAHSAGISGALNRYIAGHVNLTDGARVTSLADYQGNNTANLWTSQGHGPLLGTDAGAGIRYLDFSATEAAKGMLRASNSAVNPVTLAVVVTTGKNSSNFIAHNGYAFARAANGQYSMKSGATSAYGGPSGDGWIVIVATFDGANSAMLIGGTTVSGSTLPVPAAAQGDFNLGDYQISPGARIAEVIKWPRALDATERTAVRTALRAHYPAAA
ncbi:hypothetical protein ACFYE2_00430 [Kocuria sp. CPCC 205300]|uniref:hypothetical protein n=1 Tax=Kocuria sabuli TaxID=3071448 RepID=UPI0036D7C27D